MVQILNGQKGRLVKYETIKDMFDVPEEYILVNIGLMEENVLLYLSKKIDLKTIFPKEISQYIKLMDKKELHKKLEDKGINLDEDFIIKLLVGQKDDSDEEDVYAELTYSDEKVDYKRFYPIGVSYEVIILEKHPERVFFWLMNKKDVNNNMIIGFPY